MMSARQHGTAQPGIAADRFAREIVAFEGVPGALAAAECHAVRPRINPILTIKSVVS